MDIYGFVFERYRYYNSYMNENVLKTIDDRINKKTVAIEQKQAKNDNLRVQIGIYESSIAANDLSIGLKRAEIEEMQKLREEALILKAKAEDILEYTNGLRAKFDAYEWSPDMPWEHKIESSDYKSKTEERFSYVARMDEIVKQVNKIYFRR